MMSSVQEQIKELVSQHEVVIFMKGTKDSPMCGFSAAVAQIMATLGVEFHDVNILEDQDIREGVKQFSDWPTLPQVYVQGEFLGGCDIIREMFETGELVTYFEQNGINHSASASI